jgi:hypothetical protein
MRKPIAFTRNLDKDRVGEETRRKQRLDFRQE